MRLINNYELTITNTISALFITLFIVHSSLFIKPVFAQEASPSASPEASNSGVMTKLDEIKKEIASRAADLKAEIDKKIGNKAFSGKYAGLSIDTVTIDSELGTRSVRINEYTVFEDQTGAKSKKAFTIDSFKNEDLVIALGEVDEKGAMTAKKLIKVSKLKPHSFSYVLGQINKSEPRKLTLKTRTGVEQIISFGPSTLIKNDTKDGVADDLRLTREIIAVMPGQEASQSSFIYILPVEGLKPVVEVTATASPSASPTTKKK